MYLQCYSLLLSDSCHLGFQQVYHMPCATESSQRKMSVIKKSMYRNVPRWQTLKFTRVTFAFSCCPIWKPVWGSFWSVWRSIHPITTCGSKWIQMFCIRNVENILHLKLEINSRGNHISFVSSEVHPPTCPWHQQNKSHLVHHDTSLRIITTPLLHLERYISL